MSVEIRLSIPADKPPLVFLPNMGPDENYLALQIGLACVDVGRNTYVSAYNQDIVDTATKSIRTELAQSKAAFDTEMAVHAALRAQWTAAIDAEKGRNRELDEAMLNQSREYTSNVEAEKKRTLAVQHQLELKTLEYSIAIDTQVQAELQRRMEEVMRRHTDDMAQIRLELDRERRTVAELHERLSKKGEEVERRVAEELDKKTAELAKSAESHHLVCEIHNQLTNVVKLPAFKSLKEKGLLGEQMFAHLAEHTFKDFPQFHIENTSTRSHKGDFRLVFENFEILVDAKNYTSSVPNTQISKIKADLEKTPNATFAWLVSLNTPIYTKSAFPIMHEWITPTKCVLYINHLFRAETDDHAEQWLRMAWLMCSELFAHMNADEDVSEKDYANKLLTICDKTKSVRKLIADIKRNIADNQRILSDMDQYLMDLLRHTTLNVESFMDETMRCLNEWCNGHIVAAPDDPTAELITTNIWYAFKKDNAEFVRDHHLTISSFRDFLRVGPFHAQIENRKKSGTGVLRGYKLV